MKIILILILILFVNTGYTNDKGVETGLDLPRYVSLKSNESNLRVGPSKNYPILIKYTTANFPIKIIGEHKDWRQTIDFQNNKGWLHKSLIKGERYGIIISLAKNNVEIYNNIYGKVIGEISKGHIIYISKCKINWCLINKSERKGWVEKKYIWGVIDNEEFNIGLIQIIKDYYYKSLSFLDLK